MNRYRKGAQVERDAVNEHIRQGAILAGRFAGSKCKGKLKVDVIAIYPGKTYDVNDVEYPSVCLPPLLVLQQFKKSKGKFKAERKAFEDFKLPQQLSILKQFIEVKCK